MAIPLPIVGPTPPTAPDPARGWRANPFIHVGPDRVYDPLEDRLLMADDPLYPGLVAVLAGAGTETLEPAVRERLAADGWLVPGEEDVARRFRLKYVTIEASTHCNQACYFCPVSVAPREDHAMAMALYERILGEMAPWRATIEGVFMIAYNEPTADPRFVDQVRAIRAAGLPPAVLTNGTGLTPKRVDEIVAMGGLRYLSINLSTLDRERYRRDRQGDHLAIVLRNLDYLKDLPIAQEMHMTVLGTGDETHRRDFAEISERFAGSRFTMKTYEVMDRAAYLQVGLKAARPQASLCGCENIGSRPLQHLHITPRGLCVLCCEDYDEKYVVGDLTRQSVLEVLTGPEMAQMRRWAYGLEDAPRDFICRNCTFALKRG